jgi:hypothetical protein
MCLVLPLIPCLRLGPQKESYSPGDGLYTLHVPFSSTVVIGFGVNYLAVSSIHPAPLLDPSNSVLPYYPRDSLSVALSRTCVFPLFATLSVSSGLPLIIVSLL